MHQPQLVPLIQQSNYWSWPVIFLSWGLFCSKIPISKWYSLYLYPLSLLSTGHGNSSPLVTMIYSFQCSSVCFKIFISKFKFTNVFFFLSVQQMLKDLNLEGGSSINYSGQKCIWICCSIFFYLQNLHFSMWSWISFCIPADTQKAVAVMHFVSFFLSKKEKLTAAFFCWPGHKSFNFLDTLLLALISLKFSFRSCASCNPLRERWWCRKNCYIFVLYHPCKLNFMHITFYWNNVLPDLNHQRGITAIGML